MMKKLLSISENKVELPTKHRTFHRRLLGTALSLPLIFGIAALLPIDVASQVRRNGKIAFTSDRDGNREIYVMTRDGTGQIRLTNNAIIDDHAIWSPDGTRLAFLSQRPSGAYAIFQMNADGTGKTEITPVNYQPESQWFGFDGWSMSWSPDSRQIAFPERTTSGGQIAIVNVDGTNRRALTPGFFPAWSPDGSRILFTKVLPGIYVGFELFTIRPDGSDLRFIQVPLTGMYYQVWDSPPRWSPDGQKILFSSSDGANAFLHIAKADGSSVQDLLHICQGPGPEGCGFNSAVPEWSPEGSIIALASFNFQSRTTEIFAHNIDTGVPTQLTNSIGSNSNPSWQAVAGTPASADFDGDGRSDLSVFRSADRFWYIDRSTEGFAALPFGLGTDRLSPADYDGDGKTDISVYRDGTWFWLNSSTGVMRQAQWGIDGDTPLPADYTGDGRAELAVYRSGTWFIYDNATGAARSEQFGIATDQPVAADYDGDGRTDIAVYRGGVWYLNRSTQGFTAVQFGLPTDRPVVGDYDGDRKSDVAVYRDGTWYLLRSIDGFSATQWGIPTDIPVPADYDGDGRSDIGVFRNGTWYLLQSTSGSAAYQFGTVGDQAVPAAFIP